MADLNREMADPEVYGDPEQVAVLAQRFGEAKDSATRLMEEWETAATQLEDAGG